jgi:hypothetical protein
MIRFGSAPTPIPPFDVTEELEQVFLLFTEKILNYEITSKYLIKYNTHPKRKPKFQLHRICEFDF